MIKLIYFFVLMIIMSACTTAQSVPDTPATPTEPPLVGGVNIVSPQLGSIIYAEALAIHGTLDGGIDAFRLEMETLDGEMLFDGIIQGEDGNWQATIIHGYSGEPIEAIIRARSTDRRVSLLYDELPILIASVAFRNEDRSVLITLPSDNQQVGGDAIQISGTASGIPNNRLTLVLRHDEGLIDKQVIRIDNPYVIDNRTWSADLLTNGYLGRATVEVIYDNPETDSEQILDAVSIIIGSAAG